MFGRVEGFIGTFQELGEGGVAIEFGTADAEGDGDVLCGGLEGGGGDGFADSLCELDGVGAGGFGAGDDVFLTAGGGCGVGGAEGGGDAVGDHLDDGISGEMTPGVVDELEVVD